MKYNKLVRDKIPEIIHQRGQKATTRILDTDEYKLALIQKLQEEVDEYIADASDVRELADILEVVYTLASVNGVSVNQLAALRLEKRQKRGGFENRVFLIETQP